jgi:hypothetical protein
LEIAAAAGALCERVRAVNGPPAENKRRTECRFDAALDLPLNCVWSLLPQVEIDFDV